MEDNEIMFRTELNLLLNRDVLCITQQGVQVRGRLRGIKGNVAAIEANSHYGMKQFVAFDMITDNPGMYLQASAESAAK